tara:strand:- start:450 stop:605 length:156 start_codon:yes stop_codon:yes gene_type:complete
MAHGGIDLLSLDAIDLDELAPAPIVLRNPFDVAIVVDAKPGLSSRLTSQAK